MIVYNSNYGTIDCNPLEAHTRGTALPDFSSKIKVSPLDLFTRPLQPESGRLKLPSPFKFSLPCKYLLLKKRSIVGRLSSSSMFFTTERTFLSDGIYIILGRLYLFIETFISSAKKASFLNQK